MDGRPRGWSGVMLRRKGKGCQGWRSESRKGGLEVQSRWNFGLWDRVSVFGESRMGVWARKDARDLWRASILEDRLSKPKPDSGAAGLPAEYGSRARRADPISCCVNQVFLLVTTGYERLVQRKHACRLRRRVI
jgi:hypothetical protein